MTSSANYGDDSTYASKNKIIIGEANLIINGPDEDLIHIKNPNEIGIVVDNTGKQLSEITSLVMVLNGNSRRAQLQVDTLIRAGADPDIKINYYGKEQSARDIKNLYRNHINII